MPFKAPKGTEVRVMGDVAQVTLTEIESGDEIILDAQYVLIVDEESGDIKGHRYVLTKTENIMGKEVELSAAAVSIDKAVDGFIVSEMRGDPADYEVSGTDDEYFSQKYAAPKEDKDDIWKNKAFAEQLEALTAARGQTETMLATIRDDDTNAQEARKQLAHVLVGVMEVVKSRKALKAWAMGKDGEGANMPLLAQLGKGENALTEAMRFAQISQAEFNVLPIGITSGKGVDRHAAQAIKAIVDDAKPQSLKGVDLTTDRADIDGVETILRHVAANVFNVADALEADDAGQYALPLNAMVERVDETSELWITEYVTDFGKHINTYNKTEYEAAKRAYGYARLCSGGGGMLAAGVAEVTAYDALADDDGKGKGEILARMFSPTGGNMLVKEMYKAAKAHAETIAKEAANRAAVKAVAAVATDGDKAVFSKTARGSFNTLSPLAAAAELYALIKAHEKSSEVEAHLKSLMTQGVSVAANAAKAA